MKAGRTILVPVVRYREILDGDEATHHIVASITAADGSVHTIVGRDRVEACENLACLLCEECDVAWGHGREGRI